jgi:hypothetical protein
MVPFFFNFNIADCFILEYIVNSSSGSKWIVGMVLFSILILQIVLF